MRCTLARLHAKDKGWAGFKEKVPLGRVWASPIRPDGTEEFDTKKARKEDRRHAVRGFGTAGVFDDPAM